MDKCRDDPDLFNSCILGRPKFWHRQVEIGQSVVRYRKTVVCSGNATGKDYFVGAVVPWWLCRAVNSLAVVTGPSQTLLGTVTWKEIRRAINGSKIPLGMKVSDGARSSPHKVDLGDGWQALGYSTTSVERASGQHAKNLLVVVEEASGVDDEIWDAIDSLKYSRLLAIGNPIRPDGRFVEMCKQADQDAKDNTPDRLRVNKILIPSTDSPDAHKEHSEFGLADATWLADMYRQYGADSLWVRSHIKAIIPTESHDTLIPVAWLDRAASEAAASVRKRFPLGAAAAGLPRMSCDLGEGVGRDQTVIVVRDELGILEVVAGKSLGLPEAANEIAKLAAKWRVGNDHISYDAQGIGRDMANHLARYNIIARPYHGSAGVKANFTNLRTAAAWAFMRRLDPEYAPDPAKPFERQTPFHIPPGPYWDGMRRELLALRYDLVDGKTRLEAKEDLMTRLGHSPDFADAVCQSFAY